MLIFTILSHLVKAYENYPTFDGKQQLQLFSLGRDQILHKKELKRYVISVNFKWYFTVYTCNSSSNSQTDRQPKCVVVKIHFSCFVRGACLTCIKLYFQTILIK